MTQESVLQKHWANNTWQERVQLMEFGHWPLHTYKEDSYNEFQRDLLNIVSVSQRET